MADILLHVVTDTNGACGILNSSAMARSIKISIGVLNVNCE
jgi:hypothetical protein